MSLRKQSAIAYNVAYSIFWVGFCLLLGYLSSNTIGGLPRSLYGLIFFTALLHFKVIRACRVQSSIAWGIRNMGVCFVPAGVGIIDHFQLIQTHGLSIVAITFFTTLILLSLVALMFSRFSLDLVDASSKTLQTHIKKHPDDN